MMNATAKEALLFACFVCMATAASAQTPDRECTTTEPDVLGRIKTTCKDVKPFDPLGDLQADIKKRMQAEADRKKRIQEQADAKALAEAAHAPTSSSAPAPAEIALSAGERVWTSIRTGHDFKVRIDGEYIYTQVILPPALQSASAFVRAELKQAGDKWVGKSYAYLPYQGKKSTKWCHTETDFEIVKMSDSRIEGVAPHWSSFNVDKCQPENVEMQPFTWIPK